ncbi:MAG TPA: hypothetical protein VGL77_15110, partial [Armatimonadota bacterium]
KTDMTAPDGKKDSSPKDSPATVAPVVPSGGATAPTTPQAKEKIATPPPVTETKDTSFPWDSKTVPDGVYLLKVVASDKYAKPNDPRSAEDTSGAFTVDNTPPTISLKDKEDSWNSVKRFQAHDNISPILGGKYQIDNGPWIALVAEDRIFDRKDEDVTLLSPEGTTRLANGEHQLHIIVKDAANNTLDRTITLTIK